ncbi:bis(5'-adenosyl)-triphosphatase enpp4-like isoform X2 [Rhynchophorus ferrugineus]|uniref:bis(5'-adenosyl)-triphosphatase enpp4-like isoform X2 n=1 Tax=Rhynchophorus ferrugineus TaxID=354439 RepID=UPI003FCD49FA
MFLKPILSVLYLVTTICFSSVTSLSKHPILIVVSFDAFRYNFFTTETLPYMNLYRTKGTYAEYLTNVFPTKTFPNHHSIATGVYPEVHGVIGNSYYDSTLKKIVKISPEMYNYSEAVIPIWRWNEDQGDGRVSASFMWPGGDFTYQGKNITYSVTFQNGFDWKKRVDQTIKWILDPEKPANLIMLYFEEPDTHGHAFGPNSVIIKDLLAKLDNITGYLHQQLELNNLSDKVNVIQVSDHGMTAVTPPHFINITQYLKNGTYEWAGASPAIQIIPHGGFEDSIYTALKNASKQNGHFTVYAKSEYLDRWHYKNNPRSPPILVMAEQGYALDDLIISAPQYAKKYNFTLTNQSEFGVHGYDYIVDEMHPYFMAIGPRIKQQTKVDPFSTIDLFNLFCGILEIMPTKNNGTTKAADMVLANTSGKYSLGTILMMSGSYTSQHFNMWNRLFLCFACSYNFIIQ